MQHQNPITISRLGYAWPNGGVVFDGVSTTFSPGTTGLVGPNGSGKSTLLRLIMGELKPTHGTIHVGSQPTYLAQNVVLDTTRTVASLMGIEATLEALHRVLGNATDDLSADMDAIGEDWDLEERSAALLNGYLDEHISPAFLNRTVGTLSGGETMAVALAGTELRAGGITLLDEPTNNLDKSARHRLYEIVERFSGTLVVSTHDKTLLSMLASLAELRPVNVRALQAERIEVVRHGDWGAREESLGRESEAATRRLSNARSTLTVEKRQRREAETKIARRSKQGIKAAESMPKILANTLRNKAEASAGKSRGIMKSHEADAAAEVAAAREALPLDLRIAIDLPQTRVPAGRTIARLPVAGINRGRVLEDCAELGADSILEIRGPERISLIGGNGVGKTTLLGQLRDHAKVPVGYLPQRLESGSGNSWAGLRDGLSMLDNLRLGAPAVLPVTLREQLAAFHFRGERVDEPVSQLSGGERFRVALAMILLADPAPQLLLLDEPTNNLDMATVEQLLSALESFGGAMVVVSHDEKFLEALATDREWEMRSGAKRQDE